jgi:hypothetical protein
MVKQRKMESFQRLRNVNQFKTKLYQVKKNEKDILP